MGIPRRSLGFSGRCGQHCFCPAFSAIVSRYSGSTAGGILITALKAEAVKIVITVALLWLVMTLYKDVVAVGFIGTFILTVLIFGLALFVTDDAKVAQIKQ